MHELNKDKQLINMEAFLKNDLAFDSVDQIVLAVALEKIFKIKISDEELEKLTTIAEIVELIEKKLGINEQVDRQGDIRIA